MGLVLLVLLLILLLGGVGLASATLHVLFWIAVILFFLWLLGFILGPRSGVEGRRWYW